MTRADVWLVSEIVKMRNFIFELSLDSHETDFWWRAFLDLAGREP